MYAIYHNVERLEKSIEMSQAKEKKEEEEERENVYTHIGKKELFILLTYFSVTFSQRKEMKMNRKKNVQSK